MNTIKKFSTFDELKSFENKSLNYETIIKKHHVFEKVIKEIRSIKITKDNQTRENR